MRWTWVTVALLGCAGGGPDRGEDASKDDDAARVVATVVETTAVARGDVVDQLIASASVEAEQSADVVPVGSGTVARVYVDVGDAVRKGTLLALIDNKPVDASLARSRTQVAQYESQLAELKALEAQGAVARTDVENMGWQLRSARDALRETSVTADQSRLLSPFEGVVAARDLRVGEPASGGKRAFQIVDLSTLKVVASLPERDVARVAVGQSAVLTAAYDDAQRATATITRVAPVIDASTGTFQVTLQLDAGQSALRPGQYVRVALEVGRHADVLTLPREAVVYENGKPIVYRVKDAPPPEPKEADPAEEGAEDAAGGFGAWLAGWFGGDDEVPDDEGAEEKDPADEGPKLVAERVSVKLGLTDPTTAEVLDGVSEGDSIVVIGTANLKDGAPVRRPEVAPEPGAAAEPGAAPEPPAAAEPGGAASGADASE